jgi:anti-sigma factor (TIGR02949 family)
MTEMIASCREVVDLVTEYLDRGLDPASRRAFERHVVICPPCRGFLAQMRQTGLVARADRDDLVPEALRERLVDAFRDWRTTR